MIKRFTIPHQRERIFGLFNAAADAIMHRKLSVFGRTDHTVSLFVIRQHPILTHSRPFGQRALFTLHN